MVCPAGNNLQNVDVEKIHLVPFFVMRKTGGYPRSWKKINTFGETKTIATRQLNLI